MINLNVLQKLNTNYISNSYRKAPLLQQNKFENLRPLAHDTISFTAQERLNKSLLEAFENAEACNMVSENAEVACEDLRKGLKEYLSPYMKTETNPKAPIEEISTRIKSGDSIREKAAGKLGNAILNNVKEAFNPNDPEEIKKVCGDIVGARIILEQSTKEKNAKILEAIVQMIQDKHLKITKVENYKSPDLPDDLEYFNKEDLNKIVDKINSANPNSQKIYLKEQSKKTGYMALHIDVELSNPEYKAKNNGYKGEIQIVGRDVVNLKEVEDFCYKLKYDKGIKNGHVAYKPFSEYFKTLMNDKNYENVEENFNEYTSRAYRYQRKKEPEKNVKNKRKNKKLPTLEVCEMQDKLPAGLDFNRLAFLKANCDRIYDIFSCIKS